MDATPQIAQPAPPWIGSSAIHWLFGLAAVLAAGVTLGSILGAWPLVALCAVAAATAALAARRPEVAVAAWLAASPWLAFLLRYPELKSVATFDRFVVPILVVFLLLHARRRDGRVPALHLGDFGLLLFSVVALGSVALLSNEKGYALRTAVDAFLLPSVLCHAVRVGFDVDAGRRALVMAAIGLGLTLAIPGAVEFATGTDVMAFAGASIVRTGIVRPNGPFITDNSYALVGAVVALFLLWAPGAFEVRLRGVAAELRMVAIAGATLAAALPLFRTVLATLVVAAAVPAIVALRVQTLARRTVVAILLILGMLPLILAVSGTAVFEDRILDPSSGFSRAATYLAAADLISDHPLAGVGLTNYHDAFVAKFGSAWYVEVETVGDEGAESYPHNNVLGIQAELGIAGLFAAFVAAIGFAALAWRRRDAESLALMVMVALPGLTLVTCSSADLNLTLAVLLGAMMARHRARGDSLIST